MSIKTYTKPILLWDLPTRVLHWLLVVLVAAAFVTGLQGGNLMIWHGRIGLVILGLLIFRILWGLIGSTYARFSHFVPGPQRIVDYLHGRWRGVGHNPLGALSVLALLGVLLFQTSSGLVANDDIAFNGPLYPLVSTEFSDRLTSLHRTGIWIIGLLVGLHIAAILFYTLVRRDNLVMPMLNGVKWVSEPAVSSARGGGLPALVIALACAGLVVWMANGGLMRPVPPAPPQALPNW